MPICKKCGKEFPEYSEDKIEEAYKDESAWTRQQILKSFKKNKDLCLECLQKISSRWVHLLISISICFVGIITIFLGFSYQSYLFFFYAGAFFIFSIFWYYYLYKNDIISKGFAKNEDSHI